MASLKKDVVIILLLAVILALVWFRRTSGADVLMGGSMAVDPAAPAEIIANKWLFTSSPGLDVPGNDIKEFDGTPMDCAKECANRGDCVGFVMTSQGNHCWLKNKFENKAASDKTTWSKQKPVKRRWPWQKKGVKHGVLATQTEGVKQGVLADQI